MNLLGQRLDTLAQVYNSTQQIDSGIISKVNEDFETLDSLYDERFVERDESITRITEVIYVLNNIYLLHELDVLTDSVEEETTAFMSSLNELGEILQGIGSRNSSGTALINSTNTLTEINTAAPGQEQDAEKEVVSAMMNFGIIEDIWNGATGAIGSVFGGVVKYGEKLFKKLGGNPAKLEEWGKKIVGQKIVIASKVLKIFNEEGTAIVTEVSGKWMGLMDAIVNQNNKTLNKLADQIDAATNTDFTGKLAKEYNEYFKKAQQPIQESYRYSMKALQLTSDIGHETLDVLEKFGKYLLLSSKGFPGLITLKENSLAQSGAMLQISESVIQKALARLIKDAYKSNKGINILARFKSAKINMDDKTNTYILELTDGKVRASHSFMFNVLFDDFSDHLSGTVGIKKVRLQLVPSIGPEKKLTIHFKPRMVYLDIPDLMPALDQTLAWYLQKEQLNKFDLGFEVGNLLDQDFDIPGGDPAAITLDGKLVKPGLSVTGDHTFAAFESSALTAPLSPANNTYDSDVALSITNGLIKLLLDSAIAKHDGIRVSLGGDKYKESKDHFKIRSINYVANRSDSSISVGARAQVYLSKKVWLFKPKVNFEVSNFAVRLKPVLKRRKGKLTLVAEVDYVRPETEFKDINPRLTRRAIKAFKNWKKDIVIGKYRIAKPDLTADDLEIVELDEVENAVWRSPLNKKVNLLPPVDNMVFQMLPNGWVFKLKFR